MVRMLKDRVKSRVLAVFEVLKTFRKYKIKNKLYVDIRLGL
jgi:hypothetical protein